jgi:hypothetical protein
LRIRRIVEALTRRSRGGRVRATRPGSLRAPNARSRAPSARPGRRGRRRSVAVRAGSRAAARGTRRPWRRTCVPSVRPPITCRKIGYSNRSDPAAIISDHRRPPIAAGQHRVLRSGTPQGERRPGPAVGRLQSCCNLKCVPKEPAADCPGMRRGCRRRSGHRLDDVVSLGRPCHLDAQPACDRAPRCGGRGGARAHVGRRDQLACRTLGLSTGDRDPRSRTIAVSAGRRRLSPRSPGGAGRDRTAAGVGRARRSPGPAPR